MAKQCSGCHNPIPEGQDFCPVCTAGWESKRLSLGTKAPAGCPNCRDAMATYFLSGSHLDHGCFICGCIVDWETGHVVAYDDQRIGPWESRSGRPRLDPRDYNKRWSCLNCGRLIPFQTFRDNGGRCTACMRDARRGQARADEEARRQQIQAQRRALKQCVMCGRPLGLVFRMFFLDRHEGCKEFKE